LWEWREPSWWNEHTTKIHSKFQSTSLIKLIDWLNIMTQWHIVEKEITEWVVSVWWIYLFSRITWRKRCWRSE
jgi:hypothetical protein